MTFEPVKRLKDKVAQASKMTHPKFNRILALMVDASDKALCGILKIFVMLKYYSSSVHSLLCFV